MPTVVRAHGLRFAIFTEDHPPPHVHVSGRGSVKIALDGAETVMAVKGMSKPDVARARNTVKVQRSRFLEIWTQIYG